MNSINKEENRGCRCGVSARSLHSTFAGARLVSFAALMLLCASSSQAWPGEGPPVRKLVMHSWDIAATGPEEILANADSFARPG